MTVVGAIVADLERASHPQLRAWIRGHAAAVTRVLDTALEARKMGIKESPMNADLFRAAFEEHRHELEASGERQLRKIFDRAVAVLGPTLRGCYNHPDFARIWSETMKYVVDEAPRHGSATINEARLKDYVQKWAANELESAVQKLVSKVPDLHDVRVASASDAGSWFTVTGTRADGSRVSVDQSRILNVSSRGKLFNQWPARIYVNGKLTSEAAYHKAIEQST